MTSRTDPSSPARAGGLVLLLCVFAASGCEGSDESGPTVFTETDSAGVMVAESRAPAWAEGEGWELSPEPVAVIGRGELGPNDELFRVHGVARLSDDRIAVLNTGTREVRYFASDGSFLYAAGGAGEGPGEMRSPFHMARGTGDTLLVNDMPFLNRYGPDGSFARTEPLEWTRVLEQGPSDLRYGALMQVLPDGSVFGWLTSEPEASGENWSERVLLMAYEAREGRVSLLDWWTFASGRIVTWGGRDRNVRHPLSPELAWGVGGSPEHPRIIVGQPERSSFRLYEPDGTLLRITRWDAGPTPVTAEIAERAMALATEGLPREGREEFEATRGALPPPERLPHYFGFAVDSEGNAWVRDFSASWRDPASFTVFDPRGRWLGTVEVPPGLEHPGYPAGVVIGPDWFLGVWRNDLDVPEVRLYRLQKPAEEIRS